MGAGAADEPGEQAHWYGIEMPVPQWQLVL
jgi:hypothetical protein